MSDGNLVQFPGGKEIKEEPDKPEESQVRPEEAKLLDIETADVRELLKAFLVSFQRLVSDVQGWIGGAEQIFNNHGMRLRVIEALLTDPELADYRGRFLGTLHDPDGAKWPLKIQDLKDIVENHIKPKLEAEKKAREERVAKLQEAIRSGLVGPDGRPVNPVSPGLVTPDGRPIVMEESPD